MKKALGRGVISGDIRLKLVTKSKKIILNINKFISLKDKQIVTILFFAGNEYGIMLTASKCLRNRILAVLKNHLKTIVQNFFTIYRDIFSKVDAILIFDKSKYILRIICNLITSKYVEKCLSVGYFYNFPENRLKLYQTVYKLDIVSKKDKSLVWVIKDEGNV